MKLNKSEFIFEDNADADTQGAELVEFAKDLDISSTVVNLVTIRLNDNYSAQSKFDYIAQIKKMLNDKGLKNVIIVPVGTHEVIQEITVTEIRNEVDSRTE